MRKITKEDIIYFFQGIKKKEKRCPYCGSLPVVYDKKYFVIDICMCNHCGLFFVNPPFLPRRGLKKFYDDSYTSDATIIPDVNKLELMKSNNFKGSKKDYNERLKIIRKLSVGNRLLEFGSSWGYFLFQARAYGFYPVGIEISHKRAAFGRDYLGVTIFSDFESIQGEFDLICSFHTLEHLLDIKDIFDKFSERLSPGGTLIIEVPNFDPETKGKSVYPIIGKVHPLGFSRRFFENNLHKAGFSEINIAGNYEDLLKKPEERTPLKDVIIVHAKRRIPKNHASNNLSHR